MILEGILYSKMLFNPSSIAAWNRADLWEFWICVSDLTATGVTYVRGHWYVSAELSGTAADRNSSS